MNFGFDKESTNLKDQATKIDKSEKESINNKLSKSDNINFNATIDLEIKKEEDKIKRAEIAVQTLTTLRDINYSRKHCSNCIYRKTAKYMGLYNKFCLKNIGYRLCKYYFKNKGSHEYIKEEIDIKLTIYNNHLVTMCLIKQFLNYPMYILVYFKSQIHPILYAFACLSIIESLCSTAFYAFFPDPNLLDDEKSDSILLKIKDDSDDNRI